MSKAVENRFTSYELDERELMMAGILTANQIMYIRTQMAVVAHDILELTASGETGDTDEMYFRKLMYMRGKIHAFEGLILFSDQQIDSMNSAVAEEMGNRPAFSRD